MQVTVSVNDVEHTREIEPRLLLVHFLRDELRLTGTHWGCDTSNCGTCVGIAWGALAGELPDIDHRRARVSRSGVALGVAGRLLGVPVRIVDRVIRGLRVSHRGPTHSLTCLALWAAIAEPLYVACGGAAALALAWVAGKLAAIAHAAKACERADGGAVAARIPGGRIPVRRRDHGPWLFLASGARLDHRSDSLGLAVRWSARRARARCTGGSGAARRASSGSLDQRPRLQEPLRSQPVRPLDPGFGPAIWQ